MKGFRLYFLLGLLTLLGVALHQVSTAYALATRLQPLGERPQQRFPVLVVREGQASIADLGEARPEEAWLNEAELNRYREVAGIDVYILDQKRASHEQVIWLESVVGVETTYSQYVVLQDAIIPKGIARLDRSRWRELLTRALGRTLAFAVLVFVVLGAAFYAERSSGRK